MDKRFIMTWRNKWLTASCKTILEMAETLESAGEELRNMAADGVVLEDCGSQADDYAMFVTHDPKVAEKYDMEDASEYYGEEDEELVEEDKGS